MNFENIMIGLSPCRISIIKLPDEYLSDITSFLKKKASYVVDDKIEDRNIFFKYLHDYSKINDLIVFFNNDHLIRKRSNSQYSPILKYVSNFEVGELVQFEIENVTWDLDYDKYKISGFNEYNGRMMFVTDLNKNKINETLISRHCFFDSQIISEFGNIE